MCLLPDAIPVGQLCYCNGLLGFGYVCN
jgi:hypothetical protein